MSSQIKNVMLVGASGNLGAAVLPEFRGRTSSFNVSVLSRADSDSTFPSDVKVVKAEYTPEGLKHAFEGQDAVVSLVGGLATLEQLKFADAAVAAGVKRFIPSEYGADTANKQVTEQLPFLQGKPTVVEHLKTHQDKMSWTALITGSFFDWGLEIGRFCINIKGKTASYFDGGNAHFDVATVGTIAKALVGILKKPQETANKYIYINSFNITQRQLITEVEKQLNIKFQITEEDSLAVIKDRREKMNKGDFSAVVDMMEAVLYGSLGVGDYAASHELANDLLGLPKQTLEEETKKALKAMGF